MSWEDPGETPAEFCHSYSLYFTFIMQTSELVMLICHKGAFSGAKFKSVSTTSGGAQAESSVDVTNVVAVLLTC